MPLLTVRLTARALIPKGLPVLAQLQQLKEGFGTALVLVFMIGFKDKAFVNAALREKDRQARREFANPGAATTPATPPPTAGAKAAA